ncbi:hypothetical protein HU200_009576 [Digitaria exilis]|uniref:F-box domain-containing protein n=1 Tax=Digitaria exilis TaxID=1010633 RepID=A0A835FJF0_9POAL|nr:hypothetical protein HU200_009576 [Digitaria exilis]CAB3497415.1 unnamed protein product [Digitaria exilis]
MAFEQGEEEQGPPPPPPPWADLPPELLERTLGLLGPRDRVSARFVCASWRACVRDSDLPPIRGPAAPPPPPPQRRRRPRLLQPPAPQAAPLRAPRGPRRRPMLRPHPRLARHGLGRPPLPRPLLQQQQQQGWYHGGFRDMAFWSGGRLRALAHDGAVLAFRADLGARKAVMSVLREAAPPVGVGARAGLYLVEADGELLLVRRMWVDVDAADVEVEVHGLLESPGHRRWAQLQETPGRALFVGSAVLPVALYPEALLRLPGAPGGGDAGAARHLRVLAAGPADEERAHRRRTLGGRRPRLDHPLPLIIIDPATK